MTSANTNTDQELDKLIHPSLDLETKLRMVIAFVRSAEPAKPKDYYVQYLLALIHSREQAAELRGYKNGYINGQHDEMKDVELFWTKQPFPSEGNTTMFIHNRVSHLKKQVAELQATKPEKEG